MYGFLWVYPVWRFPPLLNSVPLCPLKFGGVSSLYSFECFYPPLFFQNSKARSFVIVPGVLEVLSLAQVGALAPEALQTHPASLLSPLASAGTTGRGRPRHP